MRSNTPGLKRRRNKDGTQRLIWVARADLVKAGYQPKTVTLHYRPDDELLISQACLRLQAEMLQWSSQRDRGIRPFDGTIASLIHHYQRDEFSSYQEIKYNTKKLYDDVLENIENAFGRRSLAHLTGDDFKRWYRAARRPKKEGGEERITKACRLITQLRALLSYGVEKQLPECKRLRDILSAQRYEQPKPREEFMTAEQASAFIDAAIGAGRLSLALGTALQFETALRQKDVIGEWEPIPRGEAPSGIVLNGNRWVNGLTWAQVTAHSPMTKKTTKNGRDAVHDLTCYPMVTQVLALVPAEARVGPLIIDEAAGRPYARHAYAREWRLIANAAGIPTTIRNMDARSGALTEADDAGAEPKDVQTFATHTQAKTTERYIRGSKGALNRTRKVAGLRVAHRAEHTKND